MREENKNVSKNAWKRVFGKKWFFPAVYLTMAALLLTGVLWYQNLDNQVPEVSEDSESELESEYIQGNSPVEFDQEAQPVMEQQEVVKMPVVEDSQVQIVTKFFDYNADSEDQENALVLYNNKYYQSKGVDIAQADGKTFDVTASLSGTVTEVKEDPLLGNVVKIAHEGDLSTYYASLENVLVETGAEVQQGDTIGSAGRNLYGQASGVHVHFELRKEDQAVDPEEFFNKPLSEVESPSHQEEESASEKTDGSEHGSDETAGDSEEDGDDATDEEDGDGSAEEENNTTENTESSAAMANA